MADKFFITINVKPYVASYLTARFGEPVDFRKKDSHLYQYLVALLGKNSAKDDSRIADSYGKKIEVVIGSDIFYRHGWELSKTNQLDFSRFVEKEIKKLLRIYVATQQLINVSRTDAVRNFQEMYGFNEYNFPFATMIKDVQRNSCELDFKPIKTLKDVFNKIFMEQMSENKTFIEVI